MDADIDGRARHRLKGTGGAYNQVAFAGDQIARGQVGSSRRPGKLDAAGRQSLHLQLIEERDRDEERFDFVVAVGTFAEHTQAQVELGRRAQKES